MDTFTGNDGQLRELALFAGAVGGGGEGVVTMKYGFPYRGSKSKLVPDILNAMPSAKNFYDLFAGGCAVTHGAILSDKWQNVHCNDLQGTPELFLSAIAGKYRNEKIWISREEFLAKKSTDHYIRWIWSFGNNGEDYLFGKDIEPVKKAAHEYLFKNGYDGTKEKRIELIKQFKADKKIAGCFELEQLEQLERLERLQQLQRLERLQRLEQLERLQHLEPRTSALDYRKVKIKQDAVVYCDPPYPHKAGQKEKYYGVGFDTGAFYSWVRTRPFPVYFSSVFAPADFRVVFEKAHQCLMNNKGSAGKKEIVERLYWNGVK